MLLEARFPNGINKSIAYKGIEGLDIVTACVSIAAVTESGMSMSYYRGYIKNSLKIGIENLMLQNFQSYSSSCKKGL